VTSGSVASEAAGVVSASTVSVSFALTSGSVASEAAGVVSALTVSV
jgi:hypothetical protein